MSRLLTAAPLLAMVTFGAAAQTTPPTVEIQNAWSRATSPAATTGAVYLTIVDHGGPDRVTAFATPVANEAQLHETTMQGNVMKMRQVDALAVTDKAPVTLAPGGYHVMLMGLRAPLRPGESFPLSVTFEKAGTIQVSVSVQALGAKQSDAGHSMDMTMPVAPQPPK